MLTNWSFTFFNRAPVTWFSKRQNTVETSTFGSEFIAMKTAVGHIETLRYKLRMFGIPIKGPSSVFCDNEAVFKNTSIPDSTLKKKHTRIWYDQAREAVAACTMRVAKEGTATNLANLFRKPLTYSRRAFFWTDSHIIGSGFLPYVKVSHFIPSWVMLDWCWSTG